MPNILIADRDCRPTGRTRAPISASRRISRCFSAAVHLPGPDIICTPLNIADGEALPRGIRAGGFRWRHVYRVAAAIYDPTPAVTGQIDFARAVFAAGVPVWGSCWGLQLATVALGGSVRRNPRGRELAIARAITVLPAGREHPLLAARPAVFDALCSHLDEIETLPPNSQVLAANEVSAVQAMAATTAAGGSFLGTQYHPEHTLIVSAALDRDAGRRTGRRRFGQRPFRDHGDGGRLSRAGDGSGPPRRDLAVRDCERDHRSAPSHHRNRQLAANHRRTSPPRRLTEHATRRPVPPASAKESAGATVLQTCTAAVVSRAPHIADAIMRL